MDEVKIWEEEVVIPTYEVGAPDKAYIEVRNSISNSTGTPPGSRIHITRNA